MRRVCPRSVRRVPRKRQRVEVDDADRTRRARPGAPPSCAPPRGSCRGEAHPVGWIPLNTRSRAASLKLWFRVSLRPNDRGRTGAALQYRPHDLQYRPDAWIPLLELMLDRPPCVRPAWRSP